MLRGLGGDALGPRAAHLVSGTTPLRAAVTPVQKRRQWKGPVSHLCSDLRISLTEPTDLHSEISSSAPSPRPLDVAHPTPSPCSFCLMRGCLLGWVLSAGLIEAQGIGLKDPGQEK